MNILITSDIHIFDYPQYNKNGFRLAQFEKLAYRLIEIAKEYNCEMLILAGDIIHKPILRPYIIHTADNFLNILESYFKSNIRFILGQHDIDTKSSNHNVSDSILPILSKHGKYMHNKTELIDNQLIGFYDWTPDQDWTTIEGIRDSKTNRVDIMIGHLTIDSLFGQDYNSSFYKLGIFGDIHQPKEFDNGKTITCNVPIPHYISDSQDGSVIILNTTDLSVKRILTESDNFKYLKIYYDDSIPDQYKNYQYLNIINRPKSIISAESFTKSIDVNTVINTIIKENKFEDIHKDIGKLINVNNIEPLNFNFKINWIKIENFRSIKQFEYHFKSGITVINGLNGSGKSSLLRAINYLFTGNESERKCIRSEANYLLVEGEIVYQDRIHHIVRKWEDGNSIQYEIDNIPVNAVGIKVIKDEIIRQLPFTKYIGLIIRSQRDPGLLQNYGFSQRIELISQLLGLNIINQYYEQATNLKRNINIEIGNLYEQINVKKQYLESFEDYQFSSEEEIIELSENLNKQNKLIEEYKQLLESVQQYEELNQSIQEQSKVVEELIEFNWTEEKEETFNSSNLKLEKLKNEFNIKNTIYQTFLNSKKELKFNIDLKTKELKNLKTQLNTISSICPICNRPFDNPKKSKQYILIKLEETNKSIIELKNKLNIISCVVTEKELNEIKETSLEIDKFLIKQKSIKENQHLYKNAVLKLTQLNLNLNKVISDCPDVLQNLNKESILAQADIELNKLFEIREKLSVAKKLAELKQELDKESEALEKLKQQYINLINYNNQIIKYTNLFSSNGAITSSVFAAVADEMSDDNLIVTTVRKLASGETRIDFEVNKKVNKLIVPYTELSGGQQTLVDILFMYKLFKMSGQLGLLILDETLKEIDSVVIDDIVNILKSMPVNNILISTHVEAFPYYDNKINIQLENNISEFTIEG